MHHLLNMKLARMRKGLKQKDLAEKLDCTVNTISRYETGLVKIPMDKLCKMADILEVTTDYLLGRN